MTEAGSEVHARSTPIPWLGHESSTGHLTSSLFSLIFLTTLWRSDLAFFNQTCGVDRRYGSTRERTSAKILTGQSKPSSTTPEKHESLEK